MIKVKRNFAFFIAEFEKAMIYKIPFFVNFLADAVKIFVMFAIWIAIYKEKHMIAGFTYSMMITYLFVSQSINNIYSFKNDSSRSISMQIRKGTIAFQLLRPVDFVKARLYENLGQSILQIAFSFIMFCLFYIFIPDFSAPASIIYLLLFIISVIAGYFIMFSICLISGISSFWFMNNWGIRNIRIAIINFLSGALVPLSMLPKFMQKFLNFLPFKGIIYTPTMIYMGKYTYMEASIEILLQFIWAFIIWRLTKYIFSLAIKRVSINGG